MRNPNRGSGSLIIALLFACVGLSAPRALAQEHKPYVFGRAVVLCIGIDKYRFVNEIQFAEADAKAVGESFRQYYGFTPSYLIGPQATKDAILTTIRSYGAPRLESGQPNPNFLGERDVLVIFFAGHGQVTSVPLDPHNPAGREGFLVPYDARLPTDLKDFRDPEQWEREAINMRELVRLVEEMKAQHVLVLADACCSGFMTQRGSYLSARYDLQLLLTGRSRAVLAATTDKQGATWDQGLGHGYFTAALLDELKSWSERGEAASLTDVFENVRFQVGNTTRGGMVPQMNSRIGEGDGEFVFLPKSLRPADVDYAVRQAATLRDGSTSGLGRGHILTQILERAAERENRKTSVKDVIQTFQAQGGGDYHFGTDFAAKDRYWRKQFEVLFNNATAGDALAMAALHYCYAAGLGTERNNAAAYHWAQEAFESKLPAGKHVLGRCLTNGIGVDRNEEAGIKLVGEAAKAGFPVSYLTLALRPLLANNGIDAATVAASKTLLEKAVAGGVPAAKVELAHLYAGTHPGTTRDIATAIRLLTEAAEEGAAAANFILYDIYATGGQPDLPTDLKKAEAALRHGAEEGNAFCQTFLACEYFPRLNSPVYAYKPRLKLTPNLDEALKWAELAASQGHNPARVYLADLYKGGKELPARPEKAREYCELAVKDGYSPAYVKQGNWYEDGIIYTRDYNKAFSCYQTAANANDFMGYMHLSRLYEMGLGVELGGHPRLAMIPHFQHHQIHCLIQSYMIAKRQAITNSMVVKKLEEFAGEVRLESRGIQFTRRLELGPNDVLNSLKQQYPESYKLFVEEFDKK